MKPTENVTQSKIISRYKIYIVSIIGQLVKTRFNKRFPMRTLLNEDVPGFDK
jgi:hypothetical protein